MQQEREIARITVTIGSCGGDQQQHTIDWAKRCLNRLVVLRFYLCNTPEHTPNSADTAIRAVEGAGLGDNSVWTDELEASRIFVVEAIVGLARGHGR